MQIIDLISAVGVRALSSGSEPYAAAFPQICELEGLDNDIGDPQPFPIAIISYFRDGLRWISLFPRLMLFLVDCPRALASLGGALLLHCSPVCLGTFPFVVPVLISILRVCILIFPKFTALRVEFYTRNDPRFVQYGTFN